MTWEFFISYEHLEKLGIALLIFLAFLLLRRLFATYIIKIVLTLSRKVDSEFLPNLFRAFNRPLQWLFIIAGLYVALVYYPHVDHTHPLLVKWMKSFFIILVSWGLINFVSTSSSIFRLINEKTRLELDEILIPFLSRILQFVILAIAISIILQEFDYRIGGLLTGLGLGGLAVSLAAKDALANLFGGVVIVSEKPFTIGDWIMTPSVEGTVEDISFRSTKVRTFDEALVTVPNATLANEAITNWSKMGKRKISSTIRLTYDTPREIIERVISQINTLLHEHPGVHQETILVKANQFGENGLEIMLYFFTKTTKWVEHMDIREQINLAILQILNDHHVEIAIPSRKMYVENERSISERE